MRGLESPSYEDEQPATIPFEDRDHTEANEGLSALVRMELGDEVADAFDLDEVTVENARMWFIARDGLVHPKVEEYISNYEATRTANRIAA
jgi:hypothetical protein